MKLDPTGSNLANIKNEAKVVSPPGTTIIEAGVEEVPRGPPTCPPAAGRRMYHTSRATQRKKTLNVCIHNAQCGSVMRIMDPY